MKYLLYTFLLLGLTTEASLLVVDSNQDTIAADGKCTLREALMASNFNVAINECIAGQAWPVQDHIELLPTVINEGITVTSTLPIIDAVMIEGPGASNLVLFPAANHNGHIFQINTAGQEVTHLSGFRIGGARSSAIDIVGSNEVIVDDVRFLNNTANINDSFGGAINGASVGWLRVFNSEFTNNQANTGGAIYLDDALVEISNSVFSGNTATQGGAIYNYGTVNNGIVTFIIKDSHFNDNQNTLAVGRHKVDISRSVFHQNTGNTVLFSQFNNGNITDSMFADNSTNVVIHQDDFSNVGIHWSTFVDNQGFEMSSTLSSNPQLQRSAISTTNGCIEDNTSNPTYHRNVDSGSSCSGIFEYDIKNTDPLLLPVGYYGGDVLIAPPSPISPLVDVDTTTACDDHDTDLSGEGRARDGDGSGGLGQCDIGAVERPNAYGLSLSFTGTGDGEVSLPEFDLICQSPDACLWPLPRNETFSFEPSPNAGSTFITWGNSCSGDMGCDVTMTGFKFLSAEFASLANPVTLSIHKFFDAPGLSATVTSTPAGINCGPNCSADFLENDVVILSATLEEGAVIDTWSGCDSIQNNDCHVTLTSNTTVNLFVMQDPDIIFKHGFE